MIKYGFRFVSFQTQSEKTLRLEDFNNPITFYMMSYGNPNYTVL